MSLLKVPIKQPLSSVLLAVCFGCVVSICSIFLFGCVLSVCSACVHVLLKMFSSFAVF